MKNFKTIFYVVLLFSNLTIFAQGSWETISPYPTLSNLLDVEFVTPEKGWIVGTQGTILYTEDGGNSWETQYQNDTMSIQDIFFLNENEGWATGWHDVLHTTNGGEDWEFQNLPLPLGLEIGTNSIYFSNENEGWIGGDYLSLYKTVDGGNSWQLENMGNPYSPDIRDVHFTTPSNGLIMASNYNEPTSYIQITDDYGVNWYPDTLNFGTLLALHHFSDDTIYGCGQEPYIVRSVDNGKNWTIIAYINGFKSDIHFFDSNHGIILGFNKTWHTYDGGITWEEMPFYSNSGSMDSFSFINSTGYAVGYNGAIYKSINYGLDWEKLGNIEIPTIKDMHFTDSETGYAIGSSSSIFHKTNDGGHTWSSIDLGNNYILKKLCFPNPTTAFVLEQKDAIYKSTDAGNSWEKIETGLSETFTTMDFYDQNIGMLGGLNGDLYKTINGGQDWENIYFNTNYNILDIQFVDENNIWITTNVGKLYHSSDGGQFWNISLSKMGYIDNLFFLNSQKGFVLYGNGLLEMTTDGGENWEEITTLPDFYAAYSNIDFVNENEGWIINGYRQYYTTDGGYTWTKIVQASYMSGLFFLDDSHGWIYGSNSFFLKYHKAPVSIAENPLIKDIQIFPNPSDDFVNIQINENNYHTINIYTMDGKIIQTQPIIENEESLLDITSFSKGIYLFEFIGENKTEIVKVFKK